MTTRVYPNSQQATGLCMLVLAALSPGVSRAHVAETVGLRTPEQARHHEAAIKPFLTKHSSGILLSKSPREITIADVLAVTTRNTVALDQSDLRDAVVRAARALPTTATILELANAVRA